MSTRFWICLQILLANQVCYWLKVPETVALTVLPLAVVKYKTSINVMLPMIVTTLVTTTMMIVGMLVKTNFLTAKTNVPSSMTVTTLATTMMMIVGMHVTINFLIAQTIEQIPGQIQGTVYVIDARWREVLCDASRLMGVKASGNRDYMLPFTR